MATAHAQIATKTNISAKPLTPVAKPEAVDRQWKQHVCALLPQPCDTESLKLFTHKDSTREMYFVVSDTPLAMSDVEYSNKQWTLKNIWNLSGYKHSAEQKKMSETETHLTIAPALYPAGPNKWSIAVVYTTNEIYSGGGSELSTADFVVIDGFNMAVAKPIHAPIPFSCSKMVRACFTEKEYAKSSHCHDESEGTLSIVYNAGTNPSALYPRKYIWRQTQWLAHSKREQTKTTTVPFTDSTANSVLMCGGQ